MATQTQDPFLAKALARLDEFAKERQELLQRVQAAQVELRRIEEQEMDLTMTVEGYVKFMGIRDHPAATLSEKRPRTPHLDLPRGAYAELAYDALVNLGGSATLGQIVDYLRRNGRIPDADHSYYSTRSALNRHDQIEKTEKGFKLKRLQRLDAFVEGLNDVPRDLVQTQPREEP